MNERGARENVRTVPGGRRVGKIVPADGPQTDARVHVGGPVVARVALHAHTLFEF